MRGIEINICDLSCTEVAGLDALADMFLEVINRRNTDLELIEAVYYRIQYFIFLVIARGNRSLTSKEERFVRDMKEKVLFPAANRHPSLSADVVVTMTSAETAQWYRRILEKLKEVETLFKNLRSSLHQTETAH